MGYIEAYYFGVSDLRPHQKGCFNDGARRFPGTDDFVRHRLWSIVKTLEKQNVPWAVVKEVLESSGDWLKAGNYFQVVNFKPEFSESCCNDPQNTPKNKK